MFVSGFARSWFPALIVVWVALQGGWAHTQDIQPVNSGANPYRTIRNWGMVPEGRPWGAANGVRYRSRRHIRLGVRPMRGQDLCRYHGGPHPKVR